MLVVQWAAPSKRGRAVGEVGRFSSGSCHFAAPFQSIQSNASASELLDGWRNFRWSKYPSSQRYLRGVCGRFVGFPQGSPWESGSSPTPANKFVTSTRIQPSVSLL